jgi:riboflavin biosynthesis pyrimidine reductase
MKVVLVGGGERWLFHVKSSQVVDKIRLFLHHVLHGLSLRQLAVEGFY